MIKILPLNSKITAQIQKYSLTTKFSKQLQLLSQNPQHPSLRLELLEPKQQGIYSFRIDLKFRALCLFRSDLQTIEILKITVHYH